MKEGQLDFGLGNLWTIHNLFQSLLMKKLNVMWDSAGQLSQALPI